MKMLPENLAKVTNLIGVLTPRIIGKVLPTVLDTSQQVYHPESVAISIQPISDKYRPGDEMFWYCWEVEMRSVETGEVTYHAELNKFVPVNELNQLFKERFGTNDAVREKLRALRTA